MSIKVAYLTSCYPCVSHTFISREISSLRDNNITVYPYTINDPQGPFNDDSLEDKDLKNTTILKRNLFGSLCRTLFHNPSMILKSIKPSIKIYQESSSPFMKKIGHILLGISFANYIEKHNVKHIHVHFVNSAVDVAYIASKITDTKLSISIHGPDSMEDISKFDFIRRVTNVDKIRVISNYAKQQVLRFCGDELLDKIKVIHCGVAPVIANNIKDNDFVGLTVGRLVTAKGQSFLLRALYELKEKYNYTPKWEFIGGGSDETKLKQLTEQLGLESQVTFYGAKPQEFVQEALNKCAIFVLPSLAEGIPVSLMEAMVKGIPVISTYTNGIPELIIDRKTGYLCKPANIDDLVLTLKEIIENIDKSVSIGLNGSLTILADFNSLIVGLKMSRFIIE